MQPYWAEISDIVREAPEVSTFWLKFLDPALQEGFHFKAGQFNMISVPGLGEAAISISSDLEDTRQLGHTIRSRQRHSAINAWI
jgi:NAD(P)H-flavin reductase